MKTLKSLKLTVFILLLSVVGAYAQDSMTMFEKIRDEQVPAAVLKTFESDFGQIRNEIKNGEWYAHFQHTVVKHADQMTPGTSKAIPLHYSYIGKIGKEKVEIKFTPGGKLANTKGIDNISPN